VAWKLGPGPASAVTLTTETTHSPAIRIFSTAIRQRPG
jgi:hypothetical protein